MTGRIRSVSVRRALDAVLADELRRLDPADAVRLAPGDDSAWPRT
jgi:hypothetical protein